MGKKNNARVIIMLVIIILGLGGFIIYDKVFSKDVDNNEKENNVQEEQTQEDQNVDTNNRFAENESKYSSVIDEYSRAMKDVDFENDNESETKYPYINNRMMTYYHIYNSVNFKYLYYDINKDGNDELVVGDGDKGIFEIYTYNNKPVRLFDDVICLGDRCSVEIWDNGTLHFEGSGGASAHYIEFYKIGIDGYSKETINKYYIEFNDNNDLTVTDLLTNKVVNFNTTDDIISSVKGNANDVDLSKLDWVEIK